MASVYGGSGLEHVMEELKGISDIPVEIRKLITMVRRMNAVMKDAVRQPSLRSSEETCSFQEIKQMLLDAEDLFDELVTDVSVQKLLLAPSESPAVSEVMMQTVKEMNDRLVDLADRVPMSFLPPSTIQDSNIELFMRRKTEALLPDQTRIVGRVKEKKEIEEMLLSPSLIARSTNENGAIFSVLPILGMGGIGKTTLARFVYNDQKLNNHFDLMMWACVSNDPDRVRLTQDMIESAYIFKNMNRKCQTTDWHTMQRTLLQEIEGKTFLLVLDDVWEAESAMWENLFSPLHYGQRGSRVLVTSRNMKFVSKIVAPVDDPVHLKGLCNDDTWDLLKIYAFGGATNRHICPRLEVIGKSIVPKLKGSPLATRTIGSLLNRDLNEQHWKKVLESEVWTLEQGEDGILPALQLSYQNLNLDLRQCFAYCSLYPKRYKLPREIVQCWESLVFSRKETIESNSFDKLLYMSFIESLPDGYGDICYVLHDLMHDLAESESMGEYFRLENRFKDQEPFEVPSTTRHISVPFTYPIQRHLVELCGFEKLRSLLFHRGRPSLSSICLTKEELDMLFKRLKMLRVLSLFDCGILSLPNSVDNLKHLRYLDLTWNLEMTSLPESLGNLYNLRFLNLLECRSLRSLPPTMSRLVNLRDLRGRDDLCSGIDGLGKLTSLREVCITGAKLSEVGGMRMLQQLTVNHLEYLGSVEEATLAKLATKKYLQQLTLSWYYPREFNSDHDREVLQALQPNDGIQELHITGYAGDESPAWLQDLTPHSFTSLRHLHLSHCYRWKCVPCSSLIQLRRLKHLHFHDIPFWEVASWDDPCPKSSPSSSPVLFPSLCELKIEVCHKVMELPPLPPMLKLLHIRRVGISRIRGSWEGSPVREQGVAAASSSHSPLAAVSYSLSKLYITGCYRLTSVGSLLQLQLPHLMEIMIQDCPNLVDLPEGGFRHLASLKRLSFVECPKLTCPTIAAGKEDNAMAQHLPCSLHTLEIHDSGDSMDGRWWWAGLQRLTSITLLSLRGCPTASASLFDRLERPHHHYHPYLNDGCFDLVSLKYLDLNGLDNLCSLPYLVGLTSLETLEISNCSLIQTLQIVRLPRCLKKLTLKNCKRVISLTPPTYSLVSLEHLTLDGLHSLSSLPYLRCLTSLKTLEICNCSSIQTLGITMLPRRLKELTLRNCTSLISLPDMLDLVSLKYLTLDRLAICSLPYMRDLTSLEHLRIRNCSSIQTLQVIRLPPCLKALTLQNCTSLLSLPHTLGLLSSLERLEVAGCTSISTYPANGLPPKVWRR